MGQYNYRFLARICIEAQTSFGIGSGQDNILTDSLVVKDVNGLPYIPGTSLAGVFRHSFDEQPELSYWGGADRKDSSDMRGSRMIFTSAQLIDGQGKVIDGSHGQHIFEDPFLAQFMHLPVRQHVKMNEKGVALQGAKFDEQVVFKGTRFCFEVEMLSTQESSEEDKKIFIGLLERINSVMLRLGRGIYRGLGEFKVVSRQSRYAGLDLKNPTQLALYLEKSVDLADLSFWEKQHTGCIWEYPESRQQQEWATYQLVLKPTDFFLFGSGEEDEQADITPVRENFIRWNEKEQGTFVQKAILIPGSSLKGALAHRVAFHYNKLIGRYADCIEKEQLSQENPAVEVLFGCEDKIRNKKGNIIIKDVISTSEVPSKVLSHVSIDRFTGGAIQGALFREEVIYGQQQSYETTLLIDRKGIEDAVGELQKKGETLEYRHVWEAFRQALNDLLEERLPVGGGVNRGNGCMQGVCKSESTNTYGN